MCDGSVASAGPPVNLPLGQTLTQTAPRNNQGGGAQSQVAATGTSTPRPSANPNLGNRLDITA
jgi:hypothetical protein